jgi:hypothetical protein
MPNVKHFTLLTKTNTMKTLRIIFTLIIALQLMGCQETIEGNGNEVIKTRILNDFDKIKISGMFEVVLEEGDPGIKIETDENLIPYITTDVENEVLRIATSDVNLSAEKLLLTINYDKLKELNFSGAVKLSTADELNGDEFRLSISGAGSGDLEVDLNELNIEISGGAELNIKGKANVASYDISGAGEVNAFELFSKEVYIDLSGAGEVNVNVESELDVEVSGAAEVNYIGSPKIREDISGAGSLNKKN